MPTNQDPIKVADALADYTLENMLDGVDIDYQDNAAMISGTGIDWLISFTRQLKKRLPNKVIMHAPQAPYFSRSYSPKGGYLAVHEQVGDLIDLYLVQFYNQGITTYDTYEYLFQKSNGWSTGTAVKELISKGIPSNKIVVGKPTLPRDATNTGWVDADDLGRWTARAFDEFGWYAGIMQWQYKSDVDGQKIRAMTNELVAKYKGGSPDPDDPIIDDIDDQTTDGDTNTDDTNTDDTNTDDTNTDDTNTDDTNTDDTNPQPTPNDRNVDYPVRMSNINNLKSWWPPSAILKEWGVPGMAPNNIYNFFSLELWTNSFGPTQSAIVWANPATYLGPDTAFGSNNNDIKQNIAAEYQNAGSRILISAFGNVEFPTTAQENPVAVATKLADFVINNHFHGVNVKYQDMPALDSGTAEAWLISFYTELRILLPDHIIVATVKPSYCTTPHHKYYQVNAAVGEKIDFYVVEYYNDGNTYDTYDKLFVSNSGAAVKELVNLGF